ncbi:uridine kinase [Clostridiales bacterium COT073_COT-073]|nr:uridine kinase [Clostridiales bacterium COT073_COT-073]
MSKVIVVGVAGGSASGKSTVVKNIRQRFGHEVEVIMHDSYYNDQAAMSMEERYRQNYDHPNAYETEKMVEDIRKLKAGQEIARPEYDYTLYTRAPQTVLVKPKRVIIIEGILVLEDRALRDLMDIKIYVDTDADERLMRRLTRDMAERGRSVESVLSQYRKTVKPMHEQYVEPSKKYADIILPRGGENKTGIEIIMQHLKSLIQSQE